MFPEAQYTARKIMGYLRGSVMECGTAAPLFKSKFPLEDNLLRQAITKN
jgi:hypothetical protein